jgi:hypothetical protein
MHRPELRPQTRVSGFRLKLTNAMRVVIRVALTGMRIVTQDFGRNPSLYSETNVMHFLFSLLSIKGLYMFRAMHGVSQWLRHCVTNRKVAGSIADGVI